MNKVGDYVRTNDRGIRRIGKIIDDLFYKDEEDNLHQKGNLIKSSPNIIDLIEIGDYVNGYKVLNVLDFNDNSKILSLEKIYDNKITNEDIKSIVTKEQFEEMEYKI